MTLVLGLSTLGIEVVTMRGQMEEPRPLTPEDVAAIQAADARGTLWIEDFGGGHVSRNCRECGRPEAGIVMMVHDTYEAMILDPMSGQGFTYGKACMAKVRARLGIKSKVRRYP